ncbi:MAG TPA: YibE/F family protein [Desulfomonilaceae bacterium]|nr:YibE/F family protein [Desulfomonilaceae bacterium]
MKKPMTTFIILTIVSTLAVLAFIVWGLPYFLETSLPSPTNEGFGSETVPAQVLQIIDQGTVNLNGVNQAYQILSVKILSGQFKGTIGQVSYGKDQIQPEGIHFRTGDEMMVVVSTGPDGSTSIDYADAVRTRPILILLAVFIVALLSVARWKGFRSLLALAFSFVVVIGYIIPHIIHGEDPVRVSIIGSMILLIVTLYLTYGWNIKTHSAVIGILVSLAITGVLAWLFVKVALLTGNGNEEAMYLIQMPGIKIDLRGLLLGGIIIGSLGVLDDLVITQASAVFELREANQALGLRGLFGKAYRIGQDHIASTVNTLVMAYTGVALPLLLLFSLARGNYGQLINVASVAEEIVRTIVGSVGLVAAVPVSTFIATLLALYSDRLGTIRPYLGPETDGEVHSH